MIVSGHPGEGTNLAWKMHYKRVVEILIFRSVGHGEFTLSASGLVRPRLTALRLGESQLAIRRTNDPLRGANPGFA